VNKCRIFSWVRRRRTLGLRHQPYRHAVHAVSGVAGDREGEAMTADVLSLNRTHHVQTRRGGAPSPGGRGRGVRALQVSMR
jgi:hypothetical protein